MSPCSAGSPAAWWIEILEGADGASEAAARRDLDVRPQPEEGREQKGVRPCLVVSTDALNRSAFGTVIICPITTTERPHFKWRVAVATRDLRLADTAWEPKPHWVETDQIVTVDTEHRALRHLATVASEEKLRLVDDSLRMMLNL